MVYICRSDDESDNEIDDADINKILIVTQTPPSLRKHPGGDRTSDFVPRSKMTSEMTKIINDGLCYYEQDLWEQENEVIVNKVSWSNSPLLIIRLKLFIFCHS